MNTLSARENFHRTHDEKQRSELSALVNSTSVKTMMNFTLAYLVETGASREQLSGARAFGVALLNLADPIIKADEFKPVTFDPVPTKDGR